MRRSYFLPLKALTFCCFALLIMMTSGCGLIARFSEEPEEPEETFMPVGDPVPYRVSFSVVQDDTPAVVYEDYGDEDEAEEAQEKLKNDNSDAARLISLMQSNSMLVQLKDQPPDSILGLERRARSDRDIAVKAMQSLGYYDGKAAYTLDSEASPVRVLFELQPGSRYHVGEPELAYEPELVIPEAFKNKTYTIGLFHKTEYKIPAPSFPLKIEGVEADMPVDAAAILDAVDKWPDRFKNYGFPFAEVTSSRYFLNKDEQKVVIRASLNPGPPATMGEVKFSGLEGVNEEYLRRLIPWTKGRAWSDRLLEYYRTRLLETGLFRSVDLRPMRLDELEGQDIPHTADDAPLDLPIVADLGEMAFRTVGGGLSYSSDKGAGVRASWVHRNFFGNGEKVELDAAAAKDEHGVKAEFTKPAFLRANQSLLLGAHMGREESDAYDVDEAALYTGIERKLAPFWWGDVRLGLVKGEIDEGDGKEDYDYSYLELGIRRDTRNSHMNPTKGTRLVLRLAPYTGRYQGETFTAFMPEAELSAYWTPFESKRLTLAARLATGGMFGAAGDEVPATLRYFTGGGGSVRGYAYQAIGPRNHNGEPSGGTSYQEINLEMRIKITENIGLVPFIDGGAVSNDNLPDFGSDLDWGAGLGLRYYTPVGPLRVDFGVPLTNIKGEDDYQVYISLGQSF